MTNRPGRFRALIRELKRRHVFRVASFYVVAAWAAIEVSATILPALGLSERWVTFVVIAAIIGLPVTLILAWVYDVTSEGLVRTGGAPVARAGWLRPLVLVVAAGVVVLAAWAVVNRVRGDVEPSGTTSIAIFPFQVQGSPSLGYLREGMVSLLSTNLNGAGGIHVIDPAALIRSLGDASGGVDLETARRVAARFEADLILLGEVSESDGRVLLRGRLYEREGDDALSTIAVPGPASQVTSLVDQFTEVLLSEQLQREGMRMASTAALTTASLPALRAYLTGESEYRASQWDRAMSSFKQAVLLDSTFALAHYRLGSAAEWAAAFGEVERASEAAHRLRGRLSDHDRDLVNAFYAWTHGDAATAEELYREITDRHPEDAEAWYRLGEVLYHYNAVRGRPSTEAKAAFENALALAPGQQPIIHHLMEIALYQRDEEAFDSLLTRAGLEGAAMLRRTAVRDLTGGDPEKAAETREAVRIADLGTMFVVSTSLAQHARALDEAERIAGLLTAPSQAPVVRGTGHLVLAQIAAGTGRWEEAREQLDSLATIHPANARVHRALYASLPFMRVAPAELEALRGELERWEPGPDDDMNTAAAFLGMHDGIWPVLRLYALGLVSARLGDQDAAGDYADRLMAWEPADPTNDTERHLAIRLGHGVLMQMAGGPGGNPGVAARSMPAVDASVNQIANSAIYAHALERYTRGVLLAESGATAEAMGWLAASMEGRNEIFLLGPASFALAELYEQTDQPDRAAQYYSAFLRLWEEADGPRADVLDQARARLRSIRGDR